MITLYKLHDKLGCVSSQSSSSCLVCRAVLFDKLDTANMHEPDTGRLKMREWKMQEEIARVENGGVSRMESQTENIFSVTTILTAIRF